MVADGGDTGTGSKEDATQTGKLSHKISSGVILLSHTSRPILNITIGHGMHRVYLIKLGHIFSDSSMSCASKLWELIDIAQGKDNRK